MVIYHMLEGPIANRRASEVRKPFGDLSEGNLTPVDMTAAVAESGDGVPQAIGTFHIRVTSNLMDLAEFWPRTNRFGAARCFAFQCADVLQIWCGSIGKARDTHPLFVGVFDGIGRPVLLLPFGIEREGRIQVLRFLDGGLSDYNAPVVFEPARTWDRETVERLWQELVRTLPRFDLAVFDKMPADICGMTNPLAGLGTTSYDRSGHAISVSGTWDEYAEQRLPYKRESSAQRRRLAKVGQLAFTVATTPTDRERVLDAMLRQKSRRYQETWGFDGLDRPGYRQYYTAMVEQLSWPGPLVASALEVDGTIIATNWGLLANRRFIGIVMTFETGEWKRFSPGRVLLEELIKWNFEIGTQIFDFGIGDESYKVAYTDQTLALNQVALPVTMIGRIYHAGRATRAWKLLRNAKARLAAAAADFHRPGSRSR